MKEAILKANAAGLKHQNTGTYWSYYTPTLQIAYDCGQMGIDLSTCEDVTALEGCHRIRAAKELGLIPEIVEVEYSDKMCSTISGYDGDADYMVSEICDDSHRSTIVEFDE